MSIKKKTTSRKIRQKKEWMVMIYLSGDNNLSEYMAGSFRELGKAFFKYKLNPEKVAVMVYYDGGGEHSDFLL